MRVLDRFLAELLTRGAACRTAWQARSVLIVDLAAASADVGATSSRLAKTRAHRRRCWPTAGPDEVATVVSWLSGELPQRQIGVGWAALRSMPAPAAEPHR